MSMLREMTALVAVIALVSSGCSNPCQQLREDYKAALAAESPFVDELTEDAHFGVSMHMSLVNDLLNRAMKSQLDKALDLTDRVKLAGGQEISVKTEGKLADLEVFTDETCPSCVRMSGNIDGKLAVKVPVLPVQRVPLRGSATLVAPIELGVKEGRGAIRIDLAEMSRLGKSSIDVEIAQLPPTWSKLLKGPLSDLMFEAVAKRAGKVTIATFDPLDLGVEGLQVVPVDLQTNSGDNSMWVGFTTNLAGAAGKVEPISGVTRSKNFAMSLHPSILASAGTAGMKAGKIARRYTKSGKENPRGPFHATLQSVEASKAESGKAPFTMNFRLWNLPEDGQCYWLDASANGLVSVSSAKSEITADIESMKVRETSMNDLVFAIATWGKSEFIDKTRRVLSHSLSKESFSLPGSEATIARPALEGSGGTLTVRGQMVLPAEDAAAK